jgi:acyl-CoA reductase-like NAD-dependent aldehyde dehydrogenase
MSYQSVNPHTGRLHIGEARGGIRNSGCGREAGRPGIHAFVNSKMLRWGPVPAPA